MVERCCLPAMSGILQKRSGFACAGKLKDIKKFHLQLEIWGPASFILISCCAISLNATFADDRSFWSDRQCDVSQEKRSASLLS